MHYTIKLPEAADAKLQERARANHTTADAYLEQMVADALSKPTLREILEPVHQEFQQSKMSEKELDETLSEAINESRRNRKGD